MASDGSKSGDLVPGAKQLGALRGALEHSLTIQRARLQEVVDEFVSRGALSATEANRLVDQLLSSSKAYSQALLSVLDSATAETRKTLDATVAPVVATAGRAAGKVADTVRAAPKLVKRSSGRKSGPAPVKATTTASDEPIAGYSTMSVPQIRPSLSGLSAEDLRRVRDLEASGKKRKSLLAEIDKLLGSQT